MTERHLFVPSKVVSWEAQVDRAHKLAKQGEYVYVHRHAYGASCNRSASPNEGCVAVELTPATGETNVLLVSDTENESSKTD